MFRFGEDLFFAGQASCAKTAEEGRQRAFRHALQELLNYAQAASASGIAIATQMIFQEPDSPGCPSGTVTVWRLVRVDAEKVQKLAALTRQALSFPTSSPTIREAAPRDLTPRVGMSREEILERFGRPYSILLGKNGLEVSLEYPRFGLTLLLNRHNLVKGWTLVDPVRPKSSERQHGVQQASDLDLTKRLRELETIPDPVWNVVYNAHRFSVPFRSLPTPPGLFFRTEYMPAYFSSKPFQSVTRTATSVMISEYLNGLRISPKTSANCDFADFTISLSHLPHPTGPTLISNVRLNDFSDSELQMAVLLTARAIGYDLRHLAIQFTVNLPLLPPSFQDDGRIDAPGVGMLMAIMVASAILEDPMRADLALVGRLDNNLNVGAVDELEGRNDYCLWRKDLILPGSQTSPDLVLKKQEADIRVVGVNTLLEAYELATGRLLRRAN
jgi:hypothetical protein